VSTEPPDPKETLMLTYHDDPTLKAAVLTELAAHREADQITQGRYWEDGKGCAVGCLTHDPNGGHDQYPSRWGIPEWLAHLEDRVFEGLPAADAKRWPERFMAAIPVGVQIGDDFAHVIARGRLAALLELAPSWPESCRDQVSDAIRAVMDATTDEERAAAESAAESAARSAASAARSAESAAWSAAWSAWSAAWSAESAESAAESAAWSAESAWSAARSARAERTAESARAAWKQEADRIITCLEALS
jgi:hypothetical protein